jgi:hypothetical protein
MNDWTNLYVTAAVGAFVFWRYWSDAIGSHAKISTTVKRVSGHLPILGGLPAIAKNAEKSV